MASITYDYAMGPPWVMNDDIEAAAHDAYERGRSIYEAISDEEIRQLRSNPEYAKRVRRRYAESGVDAISVTVSRGIGMDPPAGTGDFTTDLLRWQARFDAVDWLHKIVEPGQLSDLAGVDDVGIILNTQHLDRATRGDLDRGEQLFNAGIRVFQLTYNKQNAIGTGCLDMSDGGLSNYGQDIVDRLNRLGGIVDLSHCAPRTTADAIEYSDDPVAFTHTFCRDLVDHPRAKTDEELRAVAEAGGYVGILAIPWFYEQDEQSPLEVVFEHIDHAVDVVGTDHVGIGTDFAHVSTACPSSIVDSRKDAISQNSWSSDYMPRYGEGCGEFESYSDFPVMEERLSDRYTDTEVEQILGENFQAFWERVDGK
jgi:membrane dipeptidase